jgi:hypothetical protein
VRDGFNLVRQILDPLVEPAAMSAPAPLLGEKQTSGGRLAATDFMSTHPSFWSRPKANTEQGGCSNAFHSLVVVEIC